MFFFVFGSCSFVRLLNFSGSGFFCFFLLSQVVSFFSVSFLFLSLWFSLSGCGFIFLFSSFFQAVILVLFSCLVSFALVRLCSLVLCLLSLSGG